MVHVKAVQFGGGHEPEFGGLTRDGEVAADNTSPEADVELAADLAVAVGDYVARTV